MDSCFVAGGCSLDLPDIFPDSANDDLVRAWNYPGCMVARPIAGQAKECIFQWLLDCNYGGWVPRFVQDSAIPLAQVKSYDDWSILFQPQSTKRGQTFFSASFLFLNILLYAFSLFSLWSSNLDGLKKLIKQLSFRVSKDFFSFLVSSHFLSLPLGSFDKPETATVPKRTDGQTDELPPSLHFQFLPPLSSRPAAWLLVPTFAQKICTKVHLLSSSSSFFFFSLFQRQLADNKFMHRAPSLRDEIKTRIMVFVGAD